MDVRSVDERDQKWEIPFPPYRVYFWENPIGHPVGYSSYTYEVTGATNVQQVLAWAEASARGRTYQVFVAVHDQQRGVGLLSLCGSAPTDPRDPRAKPPDELQAAAEMKDAEHLAEKRRKAEARVRAWLKSDDVQRRAD